jgi:hypothetical protein
VTAELRRVVDELRAVVSSRAEWHMLNSLPAGSRLGADRQETFPPGCRALLEVSDGPTCGDVTVFSAAYAPVMQSQAEPVAGMAVPLNRGEWFCCGAVRGDPLFVSKVSGEVWYFPDTGVLWWMSDAFEKAANDLQSFFLDHMAGPGYLRLTGCDADDQWARLLASVGRL